LRAYNSAFLKISYLLLNKANNIINPLHKYLKDIKEAQDFRNLVIENKFNEINLQLFDKINKEKPLFILGSGDSINNLKLIDWEIVKESNSFGLNYFFLHPFITDYYFFETPIDKELYSLLNKALNMKPQLKNVPLIIQAAHFFISGHTVPDHPYLYFNVPFRLKTKSEKLLRIILKYSFLRPSLKVNQLIHHAGSISYLVLLGHLLGIKRIVLLGVDLNNSNYFYECQNDELSTEMNQIMTALGHQSSKIHLIADKTKTNNYGETDIVTYLKALNDIILKPKGTVLYCGSNKSLLSSFLPVFSFDEEE
jgi:hypothetical protein